MYFLIFIKIEWELHRSWLSTGVKFEVNKKKLNLDESPIGTTPYRKVKFIQEIN